MKTIYKLLFMVLIIINFAMLSCYGNEYYGLVSLPEAMKESILPYSDGYISESKSMENSNAALYTSDSAQKSPGKAFILSAIVPGTGELYAENKRGIAFMATEAVFWLTYFVLHGKANDLKDDYLAFVDENIMFEDDSPVKSTATWTLEDYEHSTQSDNWHYVYTENNGNPVPRGGKFYWKDLPEDKISEPAGELVSNSSLRLEAYQKRMSSNTNSNAQNYILDWLW